MLNIEERVAAVKLRVEKIKKQNLVRRRRTISRVFVSICLLLIIGISFAMPDTTGLTGKEYTYYEAAASIFIENRQLSYIFIGFIAFVLGVSVTILCYRIRLKNMEKKEDNDA